MNPLIKKAIIGALTYIAIILTVLPFLAVYHLGHQTTLLLYAFLICFVSILSPRLRYSLPFYIVGWFVTLYRFFLMVKDFPSLGSKDIFMICKQLSARFWLAKSVISLNLLQ